MKHRPFEVLFIVVLIALGAAWFQPGSAKSERLALTDSRIGYELTFNGLRPGMTLAQAEALLGPADFHNPRNNYSQWESPLTQVFCDQDDKITQVGGFRLGSELALGEEVVFQLGQPEADIVETFGPPLSRSGIEYHYPGMVFSLGPPRAGGPRVGAVRLGSRLRRAGL